MANTASAHDRGEFWRPPTEARLEASQLATEACTRCNSELIAGSHFCHICGSEWPTELPQHHWAQYLDVHRFQEFLGLSLAALVAFIVGVVCVLAAIGTGLIYTASTPLEWQAIQAWRIEWLLAAGVAFVAGILLNHAGDNDRKRE